MRKFTVTIRECRSGPVEHIAKVRHYTAPLAVTLAIQELYGRDKFLVPDSGLNREGSALYGQIGHYMNNEGLISTDTGRVRIDVEED
ncbi:hypothetical protein D3C85_787810 [compost metagenome]